MLDLSLDGALVEHQGMLPLGTSCFLQLEIDNQPMAVQCRVVHSRVSRKGEGGILYYQSGLQFRHLSRETEQSLGALIRSYGAT